MIYVGRSRIEGRGVFADGTIYPGTVIERAPVLPLPRTVEILAISEHTFSPGIALGKITLCNHEDDPNCSYEYFKSGDPDSPAIVLKARRKIHAGEELTIDYGGAWWKDRQ